jgi:hypothetical protein
MKIRRLLGDEPSSLPNVLSKELSVGKHSASGSSDSVPSVGSGGENILTFSDPNIGDRSPVSGGVLWWEKRVTSCKERKRCAFRIPEDVAQKTQLHRTHRIVPNAGLATTKR